MKEPLMSAIPPAPHAAGLDIHHCGLEQCLAGHSWGPGIRDHFLLHFVLSGAGYVTLDDAEYAIAGGDLFLAHPGRRVRHTAHQDDPWAYYWVAFSGAQAGGLAGCLPFTPDTPVYHTAHPGPLRDALQALCDGHGTRAHHGARSAGLFCLFVALLLEEIAIAEKDAGQPEPYLEKAVRFIHFNYARDITVDDIAKAAGLSRSHLYRLFMTAFGYPPITYLTNWRVQKACQLIESTSLSMSEIACSVGFSDQFYFSRVFKKAVGMPPSRYLQARGEP
ncbi:MAG: AraC family transcriptional regulator [Ruminococcaceae bacterium]|nr:AraC family transcriptional regulator [Oscillospiraceae bacterium]